MLNDTTHFDKPAQKPVSFGFTVRCFFFSSNQVFGPVDCKIFFFKSTLPLDEEPELANSLRKLGSKRGSELCSSRFLGCWKAAATPEFQPSLWCPAIRGRCSNSTAAGAKAQNLAFVKRCQSQKKEIVLQRWMFQGFDLLRYVMVQHLFCFCLCVCFF